MKDQIDKKRGGKKRTLHFFNQLGYTYTDYLRATLAEIEKLLKILNDDHPKASLQSIQWKLHKMPMFKYFKLKFDVKMKWSNYLRKKNKTKNKTIKNWDKQSSKETKSSTLGIIRIAHKNSVLKQSWCSLCVWVLSDCYKRDTNQNKFIFL